MDVVDGLPETKPVAAESIGSNNPVPVSVEIEGQDNAARITPEMTNAAALKPDAEVTSLPIDSNVESVNPRRSGRERENTLVYVDGYAIKRENNYVLKGGSYSYGTGDAQKKPPQKKRAARSKTATPKSPRKPREVTASEKQRIDLKDTIKARIQSKQANREKFLLEHITTLKPFLDPKVTERVKSYAKPHDPHSIVQERPVYLQPDAIKADMRAYQLDGLNWMESMYSRGVGFILGDEMGLGKTLQTISLVCHLKEEHAVTGPSLIVCPLSVLYSWCNEIEKWAPSLKYLRLHISNFDRQGLPENLGDYDMVVTTYEMCKVSALSRVWSRQHFNLIVLDEGHKIKNSNSQISEAVRRVHAETRVILTGTPLANDLVELYALLNFLAPDIFTDVAPFAAAYDLSSNVVDRAKLEEASKVLDLFMIRRLKALVEKDMPKKIETKVICPLSNAQIFLYKAFLLKDLSLLSGESTGAKKAGALNNLIMQLRKCVNHPCIFSFAERNYDNCSLEHLVGDSGKLSVLDMLLRSLYKKGHRVCLFSQFTRTLDVIDDYCRMRGWSYCRFDGSTARAERNFVVNGFNAHNSDKFLFLMSTRAGGMGLNLQTADTVILFDSDWNPQADIQAEARVHRIGQKKTVFVYRMVTANTVEERIAERAAKKLYLDRLVMRQGSTAKPLEEDEEDPACATGRLMDALKFGCSAVFGNKSQTEMKLPSDEDIEILTDRSRTGDFSGGAIKGGLETNTDDFDVTKEFTSTTDFGGIDFKKIREEYKKVRRPRDLSTIGDMMRKRERKNRITMVEGKGTGYGGAVPVLNSNNYTLESGERSVFQQELGGHTGNYKNTGVKRMKGGIDFQWQEMCQVCGEHGGNVLLCPRCPIVLHLACVGLSKKEFSCCSQHNCSVCGKATSEVGGWMFRCSCCTSAYCEDHLPPGSRILDRCERMEQLGYYIKHGAYVHCSSVCENVAIQDFGWVPPEHLEKPECPPPLDVSSCFGGQVDDCVDNPRDSLIVNTKRRRTSVDRNMPSSAAATSSLASGSTSSPVDLTATPEKKPSRSSPTVYKVKLPVSSEGFHIKIGELHKYAVWLGYIDNQDGSKCEAEKQNLFRNVHDRIVGINGISVLHDSYDDIVSTLAAIKSRGVKLLVLDMDSDQSVFPSKPEITAWPERLNQLREFKKQYGHMQISTSKTNNPWMNLGSWLAAQKSLYKKAQLKEDRLKILQDLGCIGFGGPAG